MSETGSKRTGIHPITSIIPPATPAPVVNVPAEDPNRGPRNLVLCFDGTGNKYKGDGTDTNILKIFHLLDKNAQNQCMFTSSVRHLHLASS